MYFLLGTDEMIRTLALLLCLAGCAKHLPSTPAPLVERQEYIYREAKPGVFTIYAVSTTAERQAQQEICSRDYVCLGPVVAGRILIIERKRK